MKRFLSARWLLILTMSLFGTIGLFVRKIPLSSGEIAFFRAAIAAVLLAGVLFFARRKISFRGIRRALPLLLCSGAALGFNWILLFEAYRYTTVSVATLSYYFAPVLVTLACPLLFREKMTGKQWICFCMSTLGILLVTGLGDPSLGKNHFLGVLLGLSAACLYAMVVLINKFIKEVEDLPRTLLQFSAAALVLLPYVLLTGGFHFSVPDGWGWGALLTICVLHTGVAYCIYFSAIRHLPGQETAILSYLDPLVAVLLSATVLHEELSLLQWLGGALILGFTLWNELSATKKKP